MNWDERLETWKLRKELGDNAAVKKGDQKE